MVKEEPIYMYLCATDFLTSLHEGRLVIMSRYMYFHVQCSECTCTCDVMCVSTDYIMRKSSSSSRSRLHLTSQSLLLLVPRQACPNSKPTPLPFLPPSYPPSFLSSRLSPFPLPLYPLLSHFPITPLPFCNDNTTCKCTCTLSFSYPSDHMHS